MSTLDQQKDYLCLKDDTDANLMADTNLMTRHENEPGFVFGAEHLRSRVEEPSFFAKEQHVPRARM
jgi:hypothetical protein